MGPSQVETDALLQHAIALLNAGKTEETLDAVACARLSEPAIRVAIIHDAYITANRLDEGLVAVSLFYAEHPTVPPIGRADLELLLGKNHEAKATLSLCRKVAPDSMLAYYLDQVRKDNLPRVRITATSFADELDVPRKLLKLGIHLWTRPLLRRLEKNAAFLEQRRTEFAGCWLDSGDARQALVVLRPNEIVEHDRLGAWTIGCAYNRMREFGRALDWLSFCAEAEERSAFLHFELGLAHFGLMQYREALDHCATAAELGYGDSKTQWLKAHILLATGEMNAALALARRLAEENPKDIRA